MPRNFEEVGKNNKRIVEQAKKGRKNKGESGLRENETPRGSLSRGSPAALGAIEAFPCVEGGAECGV